MDTGTPKMIARKAGHVGWMTFNQPAKFNAVSYDMWVAIPNIIQAFEADPEVRVIVLTGAGDKAFVSGADISEFEAKRGSAGAIEVYNKAGDAAHAAIEAATKPTIAMIRGICIGGGLGIALTTDLRIASDNSVFAVPAARLGLGYGYTGIKRLADVVGPSFAKEIFFTARKFSTDEAAAMGLINRVVPAAELEAATLDLITRATRGSVLSKAMGKQGFYEQIGLPQDRAYQFAVDLMASAAVTDDAQEGIAAFLEKRHAHFTQRP